MSDVWADAVASEPKTYDMTREDYAFDPRAGNRGHIACWNGREPRAGDYLILRNKDQTTRYRVTGTVPIFDPPDMWMADLEFAPRQKIPAASMSETGAGATDSQ
jgi:hypothetical protein